ncbi:hypothetical protein EW026_g1639 [Hermanssonia centrifuga]|uniref:Anaphase-promoting complex subunit 4 WD40 domain-containing protein n=1 Tax=Hermanssonia centrifuga TaxID=98765 RepID=A0A4S4KRC4_9APHY|nr:hypothetical protein EW026_g1639 [Hermanssonia centrifuga]
MMDTGSSSGEIIGHSKAVNAVAIRHQRPFRAATGGDDATIVFHQGAPYKFDKTIKTHTKYVQDVKYAPSGDHFASVGSDAKVFLYDGKTGDTLGDVESKKAVTTWTLGSGVNNQQVGNVWTEGDDIVSLSMSGDLNIFDKRTGDKPARVLQGPSKPITAAVPASSSGTFIEGVADGRVLAHSGSEYSYLDGPGHTNLVSGLAVASDGKVFSAGYDDTVREITPDVSGFIQSSFSTASQPKSLAVAGDSTVFVAEVNVVEAIRSNQKVYDFQPKFTPSAVAASGSVVAVGGEDQKVRLYDWDGKVLKEVAVLDNNKGSISALAFSHDGSLLVAGDSSGKIILYDAKERKMVNSRWSNHSGRVLSLAWSADGKHCASGSLDTHVYVWSIAKPMKNIAIKNAAAGSVNAVFWLGETKLGSAGADGCVRTWDITFHA